MSYEVGTHFDLAHLNGTPKVAALRRAGMSVRRSIGTHVVFVKALGEASHPVRVAVR